MANRTTAPTSNELWDLIMDYSWDWPLTYDTMQWVKQYKVKEGHYPSRKQTAARVIEGNKALIKEETNGQKDT